MCVSPNTFSSFLMKIHTSLITRYFASPEKVVSPTKNKVAKKIFFVFGCYFFFLLSLKHELVANESIV